MVQGPGFRIFLAVAFGAFTGALVGLQLTPVLWWIGIVAGGFVGYLAYEPIYVLRGFPAAARLAVETIDGLPSFSIGSFLRRVVAIIVLAAAGFSWALLIDLPIHWIVSAERQFGPECWLLLISLTLAIGCIQAITVFHLDWSPLRMAVRSNPISVLGYYVPKFLLRVIPKIIWFCFLVGRHYLRLIHSDLRLLCGVDAAIGAAIGTYVGSAVVGALIGGVFGVLNYEIVSKRVLKVRPR